MLTIDFYGIEKNKVLSKRKTALKKQLGDLIQDRSAYITPLLKVDKVPTRCCERTLISSANIFKMIERNTKNPKKTYNVRIPYMASFSIFCNELFVMEKLLPQTVSIQEFWTGALYEYDAPAAVSLFVQLLLDLQEERKSLDGVDDYLKVNRRTAEDADHHIIEEPFELFIQRLAEHHADHPFEDGYNLGFVGTAIKISAPYQIVAKYGVEGKEEEIKESSKNFRVLHLLYLSYLLKVPIDFFLVPNYADYTISHMNLKLKNGTAKTEDITTVPNLAAKVKSFASMTPEKQKELLQLLVKRILNDSTKIGLARG